MNYTKEQVIALADQLTCHPASRSIDEIEMAGDMLKSIVMQRDELLAALESMIENDGATGSKCFDAVALFLARKSGRAAIASVKGQQ